MNVIDLRPDRLALAREALHKANETRLNLDLGLDHPVCCYDICQRLGVKVRFVNIGGMEGLYQPGAPPRIHLSALRPLQRRHFTCAHELGHHQFGHGASFDELISQTQKRSARPPQELLADMFAGHLLMPALGVKKAFNARKIAIENANAMTIHMIASDFGVGYNTVVTHLAFGLKYITSRHRDELTAARGRLRKAISDEIYGKGTVLLDRISFTAQVSLEIGQCLIVPAGTKCDGTQLAPVADTPFGSAFHADVIGETQIVLPLAPRPVTVRVAPYRFIGLAEYRFLEDEDG